MNIYFDVDYTLIDGDGRLRPGVAGAFERLHAKGHRLFLWSGLGPRWETVERHGLGAWVEDCFDKPLYRHREMLAPLGISALPDFVVDDHPHLPHVFGGCVVEAYLNPDPTDTEIDRVIREIDTAEQKLFQEKAHV